MLEQFPPEPESVCVWVDRKRPRAIYALETIFRDFIGLSVQITDQIEAFRNAEGLKVNYSSVGIPGVFRVAKVDLLFETEIFEQELHWGQWQGVPVFFQTVNAKSEVPFDLFAAAFYLLSRYEEYLPFVPDEHGRFPASQSVLSQSGNLKRPLIDEWVEAFVRVWEASLGRPLRRTKPEYRFVSTIDVDNGYAYAGKGLLRTLFGFAGDLSRLDWGHLFARLRVVRKLETDPYDRYDSLIEQSELLGFRLLFFVLFSELGPYDRSLGMHRSSMHRLLRRLSDFSEVGLHPSYASNSEERGLAAEKEALEAIVHRQIAQSRQHYLKLRLPQTYRNLIETGIESDFSMGYPRQTGWRMGSCRPVRFYDLELEESTGLVVHPFPFMDTVYIDHMRWSPEQAFEEMKGYMEQCRQFGGTLISVFHDRTFSEMLPAWRDWRSVYEQWINMAR
ncbi:hypothetical protein GC167_07790 [bacterium]|nr:hypothetical protein [bacterium]